MWSILLSCAGSGEPSADTPPAHDTSPVDDTGSWTDPLAYAGPDYSFDGSASLTVTIDGEVVCDREATLTGSPYVGDCEGCTFAFDLDPTLVRDEGDDCPFERGLGPAYERLAFAPSYDVLETVCDTYGVDCSDVAVSRRQVLLGTTTDDGYWEDILHAASGDEMEWDGTSLTWTASYDVVQSDYMGTGVLGLCGDTPQSDRGGSATGDQHAEEDLPDAYAFDTWEVDADAGVTIVATLDTTATDPFLLRLFLNDPTGCEVAYAGVGLPCTSQPESSCPGLAWDTVEAGTYTVVVYVPDDAEGTSYVLNVDGATGLRAGTDDGYIRKNRRHSVRMTGSGTATAL